jgi:benzodiazapine receptor
MKRSLGKLAASAAIVGVAAVLGGLASRAAPDFYASLQQPSWAPPSSVFGPVWTALYVMMAIALWRVWTTDGAPGRNRAIGLFLAQLVLNALWSWLFFAWHRGGAAMLDIGLMWVLIVATIVAFARIDRIAAWLMVPYLAWVSFAAALNWAVWQANPALLGG